MSEVSINNSKFWDEMCGSTLAKAMGIKDYSKTELKRYDDFYFGFYPYLKAYFDPNLLKQSSVVEFGLGYGTLSQFLASHAKDYTGVDIAAGPVNIVNLRINQEGLETKARAKQGSALEMPFADSSMDLLVAVGCFHHTGNFPRCIEETYRILRPGGQALVMVYSQYSLRRWVRWPKKLLASLLFAKPVDTSEAERAAYDVNTSGEAAPETAFYSHGDIRKICHKFSVVDVDTQNFDSPFPKLRNLFLLTVGRMLGLDLYIKLRK